MKNIICVLLILTIYGCTIHKNYYVENQILNLPKDELSLLATLEYIKHDNPDCTGDCRIEVACTYEFLDKCLMYHDDDANKIDFNEKKIFSPNVYYIKSFGRVVFFRSSEKTDYHFSPIIIDEEIKDVAMQVKKKNQKRYLVTFNLLNNQLYLGSDGEYPIDCIC